MVNDGVVSAVQKIIAPAYLVGGSLRDELLGRTPTDYDFATPLTPEEVEAAVRNAARRPYLSGRRFGTVGFKVDGTFVEVTSFRGEIYERGSRHPQVTFDTTLEDDLKRRDFTINAMAQGPDGTVIDLFGGQKDLEQRVIRSVGDASERFTEDPLRILRAARFASQLSFTVEADTLRAMKEQAHLVSTVALQRQCSELDCLLVGESPTAGLRHLNDAGVLELLLPEIALQAGLGLFEATLEMVAGSEQTVEDRWAALLHNVEVPFLQSQLNQNNKSHDASSFVRAGLISKIGTYLRWSKAKIRAVQAKTGDLLKGRPQR